MLLAKSDINREVPSVVTSTGPLKLAAVPVPFAEPLVVEPTTVVTTPERLNSTVATPPGSCVVVGGGSCGSSDYHLITAT
jgi:hypothetical protein